MKLTVTQKPTAPSPVSPRLASNFIELGYGWQVECMQAEMFFNRSFEPFYPYREINKLWYDLHENVDDPSTPFETDWRVFDWCHSGYEHNAWFAFPGTAGYQPIKDDSTFVIGYSPTADVTIGYTDNACHGASAMMVENRSEAPGGLAQDGKYCRKGIVYTFKGKIRMMDGRGGLTAALYCEATTQDPVCAVPLGEADTGWTPVTASLTVPEDGRYTFALLLEPHTACVCDDFSLTPSDACGAWKKTAVEAGAYVAPGVIRWPGGCFASFYNWRDGVGPVRPPMKSYFWGGYQYNDIGTDELASYAETVGATSMVCVNVFHPFKRFFDYVPPESLDGDPNDPHLHAACHGRDLPHFTDPEKGAAEAAAWVEYVNGDETTEGGRARTANGRRKPYNIRYWEMDNEIHRWFRPEEYARTVVLYSKAMKKVDPTIKIGIVSYCFGLKELRKMLDIAHEDVDFLADRGCTEDEVTAKINILREVNDKYGTDLHYCNTEWLPLNGADVYNMVPRSELRHNKCFMFSKWTYALDAASTLMMWQRMGDVVDFVNFNNLANTHAQSAIETPKEGAYPTAAGMMLHCFAHTEAYRPLVIKDYHASRMDAVQVQVSLDKTGSALILNVLNRTETEDTLELDLTAFSVPDGICPGTLLSAPGLMSMNTLGDRPIAESGTSVSVDNGVIRMKVQALSFGEYRIEMNPGKI